MKNMKRLVVYVAVFSLCVVVAQPVSAGFMDGLKNVTSKATNLVSKESKTSTDQVDTGAILNKKEFHAGYSKDFQDAKSDIENGKVEKAYKAREKYITKKRKIRMSFLLGSNP